MRQEVSIAPGMTRIAASDSAWTTVSRAEWAVSRVGRADVAAFLETVAATHVLLPAMILVVAVTGFAVRHRLDASVLPLAGLATLVVLRRFTDSWRATAIVALVAATLHVVAGFVAVALPDGSWDGLAYQQEAVLRLVAGWNPLFDSADGWNSGIYLNHYPKGSWYAAGAVLASTGHVEAGKLFNVTLMVSAWALVSAALLRLTSLGVSVAALVAALVALNPVVISQNMTFYVDGMLGSLFSVLVASLALFVATAQRRYVAVALLATCLMINVKFTGVVYAAAVLGLAVPIVWRWHGLVAARRFAGSAALTGIVGMFVLGSAPYVRNIREQGAPFYPASPPPAHRPDLLRTQRPANFTDADRFTRFLMSNFSRSEHVRAPDITRLKFPLSVEASELRGIYGPDMESGGFGPLYGALFLLAAAASVVLISNPASRTSGSLVLLAVSCVLVSVFVHGETWWARFVPQAWLVPMLVAIGSLTLPRRSPAAWLGYALLVLAAANVLLIGANVGWRELTYARMTNDSLQQMSAADRPVSVYLFPFLSLRQRLHERGVDFTIVETPPEPGSPRQAIPSPGNVAFWFAPRDATPVTNP